MLISNEGRLSQATDRVLHGAYCIRRHTNSSSAYQPLDIKENIYVSSQVDTELFEIGALASCHIVLTKGLGVRAHAAHLWLHTAVSMEARPIL